MKKLNIFLLFLGLFLCSIGYADRWDDYAQEKQLAAMAYRNGEYQKSLIVYLALLEKLDEYALDLGTQDGERIMRERLECLEAAHRIVKNHLSLQEEACQTMWKKCCAYREEAHQKLTEDKLAARDLLFKELTELEALSSRFPTWNVDLIYFHKKECKRNLALLQIELNEGLAAALPNDKLSYDELRERVLQMEEVVQMHYRKRLEAEEKLVDYKEYLDKACSMESSSEDNDLQRDYAKLMMNYEQNKKKYEESQKMVEWWKKKYQQLIQEQAENSRSISSVVYELAAAKSVISELLREKELNESRLTLQGDLLGDMIAPKHGIAYEFYCQLEEQKEQVRQLQRNLEVLRRARAVDLKDRELISNFEKVCKDAEELKEAKDQLQQDYDYLRLKSVEEKSELERLRLENEQLKRNLKDLKK